MAKADDLTACCEYYLEHEDERKAITSAAYDFICERVTQKDNCRAFLERIETLFRRQRDGTDSNFDREANPEQVFATEPLPDALAKHLSRRPTALFLSALREDLSHIFQRANQKTAATDEQSTDPVSTADRITMLLDMRRGYIERFEAQQKAQQSGDAIFRLLENTGFNGTAPAISVIVTLYNYSAYVRQCLESLEDSKTEAIPGGIEAVIVNDASTDDSLKQAIAWQQISRHPVRIVDKQLNTGLADARNLGLQLGRARYAFILDADNMIFPRALEQLHATIVRNNSAAVYSMLCRFRGAHNVQEGLLSYFDWDPQMLVENPYIDAMALFDREQLIKIGGYDTELYKLGWFGWEDYDLWLRIAEAKLHVSFLPNVLCLYRHHERAMSITTNLFERELVAHLIEKYRSLIETYPPKRRILGVNRSVFEQTTKTSSHACKPVDVHMAQSQ
jgi:glycosyltransferase involved in cell wall biosynthesis